MKKIGVILPTFNIEYSSDFLTGIYDYFAERDYKVIIAQTKLPHSTVGAYDYQHWSSTDLLFAEEIDLIIAATGVYCAGLPQQQFEEEMQRFGSRPIVSVAINLNLPNVYTISANCNKSISDVVAHLKYAHNCKKIAYMSACDTKSKEAYERYDAFKLAMNENKLGFNEKLYFEGKFTDFDAEAALRKVIKTKKDVHFDALVCANDMMAVGCCRFLKEIGVSVPDDVKVVGFDDAQFAAYSNPRLSTINQNIYQQGYECAVTADRILNGEQEERNILVDLEPKFRQSCGCVARNDFSPVFKNKDCIVQPEAFTKVSRLNQYMNDFEEKNTIITLLDILKGANTLRQLHYNLKYIVALCSMNQMAINLYKIPMYLDANEEFITPEQMDCVMISDIVANEDLFQPQIKFNPNKLIFPSSKIPDTPGIYILHPIFSGETNYGYLTCKINKRKFADYSIYLKILITYIAQSVEYTNRLIETEKLTNSYTELKENNATLNVQSKTDELTGILNRRGFYEFGQRTLDIVQEMEHAGIVFYADMDNLKTINDKYGHDMGDRAIKLQAEILKKVFRSSDVVGRLGGDEFGIVAPGLIIEHVPVVLKKINQACKLESKKNGLPFTISISLGYVGLEKSSLLKQLMADADMLLYKEKKKKHGRKLK